MTARISFLALVLIAGMACRGPEKDSHDDEHHHEEPATTSETRAAAAPDHLLRIAPEMLRDLRITTSAVTLVAGN